MSITRKNLYDVIGSVYGYINMEARYDIFLNDVENGGPTKRFSVFCTLGESVGSGDILILDNETNNFISWYKINHIGRDLHTNINNINNLENFIRAFCNLCREEDSE